MARYVSVRMFAPLMRQTVQIAPKTGYDGYGNAAFGSAVTHQCAVVGEMKLVKNERGQDVPSKQTIYLMSAAAIRPEDQVTLSTGDVGSTESFAINPSIVAVGRFPFTRGQFATCVYL